MSSELTIDRRAKAERQQLDDMSWVDIVPSFVRDAETAFHDLHHSTTWMQNEVLRYDAYVPERRLSAGARVASTRR